MKWFKHYSDALDDPFIQELLDEFGHAGYVAWFGLIEIISKENGNIITGDLTIEPKYLKRKLRISISRLEKIYEFCSGKVEEKSNKSQTKVKLLFNKTLEKWEFHFPKMLEIKDNYLKDLQAAGKKLSKHKEEEEEKDKEKDKKKENPLTDLESFLKNMPETISAKWSDEQIKSKTEDLVNWLESSGKRKKDYYATLRNFLKKDHPNGAAAQPNSPSSRYVEL